MKFMTILMLGTLLFSCGKKQQNNQNKVAHGASFKVEKNSEIRAYITGEDIEYEVYSKSYNQETGVISFESFSDELVFKLLKEKKIELSISGLENLKFNNFKILEIQSNLSNLKRNNLGEIIKLNQEEVMKLISTGIQINLEKILFEVDNVEISKKYDLNGNTQKTGAYDKIEEVELSGAKRFVERFYLVKKEPVFEKETRSATFEMDFTQLPPLINASSSDQYLNVEITTLKGFSFINIQEDFENYFINLGVEDPHKEYKIKKHLREARFEKITPFEKKAIQKNSYKLSKKIQKYSYVKFKDGSVLNSLDQSIVEYIEEIEIRREIIPIYY